MKLTICCLGLHDYKIVNFVKCKDEKATEVIIPNKKYRVCKRCGYVQKIKLLKYVKRWINVPKITPDNNGKVDIIIDGAGALIVCNEETNTCYGLIAGKPLGPLNKQGDCRKLGKYALGYPKL